MVKHRNTFNEAVALRELIREMILLEKKRRGKPGGPRTDVGAIRQLNPDKFTNMVRDAVASAGGDVEQAAKHVGVAKRTLYHYLDDEPALHSVETAADKSEEEKKVK